MSLTVALAGNPNSGKTTLYNQLTSSHQYVGNWPGVTVEKKEAFLKDNNTVKIVDLPGVYSLSSYTKEEVVSRDYLLSGKVDLILNIVDATNLERNLYLTTQLMEFGVPVVLALNQIDLARKRNIRIDSKALSNELGLPVVEVSALRAQGIDECIKTLLKTAYKKRVPKPIQFDVDIEDGIKQAGMLLPDTIPSHLRRYYSLKVLEDEKDVLERYQSDIQDEELVNQRNAIIDAYHDDIEGIIISARYKYISSLIDKVKNKNKDSTSVTQKIDKVVTNRILALPIFALVIFVVYFLSVSSLGAMGTNWANKGVFGNGWFIGPGQSEYEQVLQPYERSQGGIKAFLDAAVTAHIEGAEDIRSSFMEQGNLSQITSQDRDIFVASCKRNNVAVVYVPQNEKTGEPLFDEQVNVDTDVFLELIQIKAPEPSKYGIWIPGIPVLVGNCLDYFQVDAWVKSLVLDGIVGGVGAVLGFVPQIMLLFFMLAILENCGYMSRIVFILDRILRRFGLSGKSFMPLLIGTGCSVPGIMASKTIEDESSRRLTIITTTFMPCSAKLLIIALFAGAIFHGAAWVAPSVYFVGLLSVAISGIILRKTKPFLNKSNSFVMELPDYRLPRMIDLLQSMWERTWGFIKKAFVIIMPCVVVVWFLTNFGFVDGAIVMLDQSEISKGFLANIAGGIAWVFAPLGWGTWQAAAAVITGLVAKDNIVAILGVLYGGGAGLWSNLAAVYIPVAALSLMFFNLLCAPCFAAMSAIKREIGGNVWFIFAIAYQTLYAYGVSLCIYNLGGWLTGEIAFNPWCVVSLVLLAFVLYMLFRPASKLKQIRKKQDTHFFCG